MFGAASHINGLPKVKPRRGGKNILQFLIALSIIKTTLRTCTLPNRTSNGHLKSSATT